MFDVYLLQGNGKNAGAGESSLKGEVIMEANKIIDDAVSSIIETLEEKPFTGNLEDLVARRAGDSGAPGFRYAILTKVNREIEDRQIPKTWS